MSIRKLASLAVLAVLGLLAMGVGSASASTAVRVDPGGGLLTGTTTVRNTSSSVATLGLPSLGEVNCNQTFFDADFGANSSSSSITGTLTALTFTSCTDTIPVINITDCTLDPNSPFPVVHAIADNDVGGHFLLTDPIVRCSIAGSSTSWCYYTAHTANGVGNNAASTLSYSVPVVTNVTTSPGSLGTLCAASGTTGNFNVTLNHIVQGGTNRTVTLTTS